jgi:hyperosmotically inducible protein
VAVLAAVALMVTISMGCGKTVRLAVDDTGLSTRVRTALLNDTQVAAAGINVATANGVVTLSGTVRSEADRERAIAVARQISGVSDVQSSLAVAQP